MTYFMCVQWLSFICTIELHCCLKTIQKQQILPFKSPHTEPWSVPLAGNWPRVGRPHCVQRCNALTGCQTWAQRTQTFPATVRFRATGIHFQSRVSGSSCCIEFLCRPFFPANHKVLGCGILLTYAGKGAGPKGCFDKSSMANMNEAATGEAKHTFIPLTMPGRTFN